VECVAAVSAVNLKVNGGARMKRYLEALQEAVGGASGVRVGFLEKSEYAAEGPGGATLHVAQVAFWNEFGTSRAPARPFFRQMIGRELPDWGDKLGKFLRDTRFNADQSLALLGTDIKDALTESIVRWPADNAPSTIARKGFDKGLVHRGVMQRATDFEVLGG
jgi:hypothetical protein